MSGELRLFALASSVGLGRAVAAAAFVDLANHEDRAFEDGERKLRPLESVRGDDVYVLHSLYDDATESVNDKLCRMLFFLATVRDAGAARVTAVAPYLCYSRKDRRTKSRDPVATRYIATLFEAVGIDRMVTIDVHNLAAYENAFRCRTEHLEAKLALATHIAAGTGNAALTVVSPDVGGVKRAERFRETMSARLGHAAEAAFMEKHRSGGVVRGDRLVGAVDGRRVVIVDDLISTGTTIVRAARACRQAGADHVIAFATHGLFLGDAPHALADPAIDELITTDTVPPFRLEGAPAAAKHTVLSIAPLLGAAIRRLHEDGSIVDLMAD